MHNPEIEIKNQAPTFNEYLVHLGRLGTVQYQGKYVCFLPHDETGRPRFEVKHNKPEKKIKINIYVADSSPIESLPPWLEKLLQKYQIVLNNFNESMPDIKIRISYPPTKIHNLSLSH